MDERSFHHDAPRANRPIRAVKTLTEACHNQSWRHSQVMLLRERADLRWSSPNLSHSRTTSIDVRDSANSNSYSFQSYLTAEPFCTVQDEPFRISDLDDTVDRPSFRPADDVGFGHNNGMVHLYGKTETHNTYPCY